MNQLTKILATLEREGALDSKQISERGKVAFGTVRTYTTVMMQAGLIKLHKNMKGVFEITEQGRKHLKEKA